MIQNLNNYLLDTIYSSLITDNWIFLKDYAFDDEVVNKNKCFILKLNIDVPKAVTNSTLAQWSLESCLRWELYSKYKVLSISLPHNIDEGFPKILKE